MVTMKVLKHTPYRQGGCCFIYSLMVNLSGEINLIYYRKYDISISMLIYTYIIIYVLYVNM